MPFGPSSVTDLFSPTGTDFAASSVLISSSKVTRPPSFARKSSPCARPKDIVGRLNEAAVRALAIPSVVQRLVDLGNEIPPREQQTPEALATLQKAEIEKWWPIIKAANIKAE